MKNEEKLLIILLFAALVAVIIFRKGGMPALPNVLRTAPPVSDTSAFDSGPSYLMSATPYMFSPPIVNVVPLRDTGQVGQSPVPYYNGCNCGV